MPSSSRLSWLGGLLLLPLLPSVVASTAVAEATRQPVLDAALHDIACVGPTRAWAVGDHGAIWHTDNGGQRWHLQESTVKASLYGVWFVDENRGWAVGGKIQPFTWTTEGILLATRDGGQTWRQEPTLMPALRSIRLLDSGAGIVCGHGSGNHPSGLFAKKPGSADWRPLDGGTRSLWLAGDLIDPGHGVVVGAMGQTGQIVEGQLHLSATSSERSTSIGNRPLRDVTLVPPAGGWLVGDGGLIFQTDDLGHEWQTVDSLPHETVGQADLRSVAVHGEHVWIAGSPGTTIFHSPDSGLTWLRQATGIHVPIETVRFANQNSGWAVGALGTILGTRDGGQTWHTQQQGGKRAAILCIFATADQLPLEALARISKEDGYRVAVMILFPLHQHSDRATGDLQPRLAEALARLEIVWSTVSWQFPLPADGNHQAAAGVVRHLNQIHDGRALERMVAELARAIRQWRPEALILPAGDSGPERAAVATDPIDSIAREAALAAMDEAADPTRLIDLATQWDLQPWQVRRVLGWIRPQIDRTNSASGGHRLLHVASDQIAFRNGKTLAGLTSGIRGLLAQDARAAPLANTFLLLANRSGAPTGDLLAGLELKPGGDARRPLKAPTSLSGSNLQRLKRLAEKRRNMLQLVRTASGQLRQEPTILLAQIDDLIGELDAESGSALLQELAGQYHRAGQFDLEASVLIHMARRYPQSPLAVKGLLWLVQFYASGEAAHATGHGSAIALPRPRPVEERVEQTMTGGSAATELTLAGMANLSVEDRPARSVELAKVVAQTNRQLYGEPALRWPLAMAQRKRGFATTAERYWIALGNRLPGDPWREAARAEQWLAHPEADPPTKQIASCGRAESRPHLDGHLDETCWQSARPLRLNREDTPVRSPEGTPQPKSHILLARDDEYLYLAIRCVKATGADYSADESKRPYDGDLSRRDRVRLFLDIDRDYSTWYELAIDSRGWTGDRVLGSAHWNPQWFVAAESDNTYWTAEMAIPWNELTPEAPKSRHVWAVAIGRVIPNVGIECWTGPPFQNPGPENFGLLIFE
jgi:photosystem II stability/assembly factor-like uncharacterized protein